MLSHQLIGTVTRFPGFGGLFALFYVLIFSLFIVSFRLQVRWVLDQPAVGSVIIGSRLGLREHLHDNRRMFRSFSSFQLDEVDRAAIAAVQAKSQDLYKMFGESANCPLVK